MHFLIYCLCYKPNTVKNTPMLIYTNTIWLGFSEVGSAASVVQPKQHNMKPTNRKKDSTRSLL